MCWKASAAQSGRVREWYKGERGKKVTVWKETAKANAAKSGRAEDCEKRMVLNSGRGNRLLAVTDDAEGVAVMGRTTPLLKGGSANISPTGKGLLACG